MICAKEGKGALSLIKFMPPRLYCVFGKMPVKQLLTAEELRFCSEKPIVIVTDKGCYYIDSEGKLTRNASEGVIISATELQELFRLLCDGSVYAVEENIKKGYITAGGGHRVGICGTVLMRGGVVEGMRNISCLNVRIAKEVIGAAEGIIEIINDKGLKNTLIVSPPGGGKTTILRDICRILGGDGFNYKIAIADERGEIAASYMGKAVNDVGLRTCVMDGCPKAVAIDMMLRSMGPDVVITDEIGDSSDAKAISDLVRSGVKVIASAHGKDFADVKKRMYDCVCGFEKIIVLEKKRIQEVIDLGA